MLKLAEWAKKRYKAVKSSINQWPPRQGKNLYKLHLVDNQKKPFINEEEAELTQRGKKLDEQKRVKVKRTVIESDQIFTEAEAEKVLLEGEAGIGKSTFCSAFISDWAKGEILKQFELLLFIPLAEIQANIRSVTSLVEFLNILFPFKHSMCVAAAEELEDNGGENVLVVADGWDELGEDARQQGFLYSMLIKNDILPAASVLLTSRHSASAQLRNPQWPVEFDRFVEVVGFNRKNIEEYIMGEFPNNAKKAAVLIEQLDSNPLIESLCVVPLNCAIICHLWRESEEGLPTTMTELYTKIIRSIFIRNIQKTHPELSQSIKGLPSLASLPEVLQSQWQCLCEFAFIAIEEDKTVFTHDEAAQFFPEGVSSVDEQQSCFGLLQSFESILSDCVSRGLSFHFLHLTFQEFLAAYHLARQSPEKQLDFCLYRASSPRFGMMWRFFFGISCTSNKCSQLVILAFIGRVLHCDKLLLCHCSFESGGNSEFTTQVAQLQLPSYNTKPHTAYDCAAVISVISSTHYSDEISIDFSGCSLGDKGMTSLIQALASKSGRLQVVKLQLSGNKLTHNSISDLFSEAATSFNSLCNLDLSQNPLGASGIKALEESLLAGTLAILETLSLAETLTCDADVNTAVLASISKALSTHCHNLSGLDLSKVNLGVSGAECLVNVLPQLFQLQLSETMLGDKGLCAFINSIQSTCHFYELSLDCNNINSVGMLFLADNISSGLLNVTSLYLDDNPLGLDGVIALGKMLSSNSWLKKLSLRNCQLTNSCVRCSSDTVSRLTLTSVQQQLCKMPQNSTLTDIVVDNNNFSRENIDILAGLMILCPGLRNISSEKCNIALKGLQHLFHQLHSSSCILKLEYWYLNDNDINNKAVNVLIRYLPLLPRLEYLYLTGNPVNDHMRMRLNEEISFANDRIFVLFDEARVVRGLDWQSGDEDGGEGYVGTVMEIVNSITDGRRAVVEWDCGNRGSYCCGADGKYELRVLHYSGVQHNGVHCDSCEAHPIIGYRWKCVECIDYDLCTSCYMAGEVVKEDSLKHEFQCIDYGSKYV